MPSTSSSPTTTFQRAPHLARFFFSVSSSSILPTTLGRVAVPLVQLRPSGSWLAFIMNFLYSSERVQHARPSPTK